mmetsp:Transcript_19786/g.41812  ORF Transcript_19786/g.41812 Transcript_19786/m.41812 type:complete len:285 (-) Transcript_19786:235-1089(-)
MRHDGVGGHEVLVRVRDVADQRVDHVRVPRAPAHVREAALELLQLVAGDEVCRQAHLYQGAGLDARSREGHVDAELVLDLVREKVRGANVGEEAQAALGHGEEGVLGGDPEVAVHGDASASAHGDAVEKGDVGRLHRRDEVVELVLGREEGHDLVFQPLLVLGRHGLHVPAGAEGFPLALDEDPAHQPRVIPQLEVLVQREDHILVQRVQGPGPVQHDHADAALVLVQHRLVADLHRFGNWRLHFAKLRHSLAPLLASFFNPRLRREGAHRREGTCSLSRSPGA